MATLNFIKRKDVKNIGALGNVIAYCVQEYKTLYKGNRLISGINCMPQTAMKEFIATKKQWNKQDGVQFYYAVQSFEEDLKIDPVLAHNLAREWAEKCYPDHEVLVTTHLETDNIHSHIIINSVNMKTGYKIHQSTKELEEMRKENDEICIKYGLPVCKPNPNKKVKAMKAKEYYIAMAGKSWKMQMINAVEFAMRFAGDKEDFIKRMNKLGYEIKWTPTRKNITYIEKENPNHRCRDDNLHEEKFSKENMEAEFEIRNRLTNSETEKQSDDFDHGESDLSNDSGERLLESVDRNDQESKHSTRYDIAGDGKQRADSAVGGSDKVSLSQDRFVRENDNADADTAEESLGRTGWEAEREVFLAGEEDRAVNNGHEKEAHSSADRDTDNHSTCINDSLRFAGNLFKMINNQTRYHKKRIRLLQKEIEKRLAHGQKSEGYEEYEDYNDKNLTM